MVGPLERRRGNVPTLAAALSLPRRVFPPARNHPADPMLAHVGFGQVPDNIDTGVTIFYKSDIGRYRRFRRCNACPTRSVLPARAGEVMRAPTREQR